MHRAYRSLSVLLLIACMVNLLVSRYNGIPAACLGSLAYAVVFNVRWGGVLVYDQPTGRHDRQAGLGLRTDSEALSDVLRVVHLTGGVSLHAEFCAPWCIAARVAPEHCAPLLGPASHLILYHYVVEGELHVRVEGEEAFVLRPGEVVL